MSEYDADMYDKFSSGVKKQVKALRIILDSLQVQYCVFGSCISCVTLQTFFPLYTKKTPASIAFNFW